MSAVFYLLLIFVIWSLYYICLYFYYKKFSPKVTNYESLVTVHHNCYSFNAKHNYLIKLLYGKSKKKFFFLTTILLEFFDKNHKPFISVKIPPWVLFESQKQAFKEGAAKKAKLLVFLLQTKISLSTVRAVRISHNSRVGELFIYKIRLIDLITKDTSISMVQSWIHFLAVGTQPRAQLFGITYAGRNVTDIKPPTQLNFIESSLFFVFGIHWILFHTQYLIISGNPSESYKFTKTYDSILSMVLTAIVSALTAFSMLILILVTYLLLIKRNFSALRGIGFIWIIKYSFISFFVVMAIVLGLTAAFKPEDKVYVNSPSDMNSFKISTNGPKKSEWESSTLRWFALLLSYVIYSTAVFSIVFCCLYCKMFNTTDEYDLRSEDDKSFKSVETVSKKSVKTQSTQSLKEVDSSGSPRKDVSSDSGANFRSDPGDDKNKS